MAYDKFFSYLSAAGIFVVVLFFINITKIIKINSADNYATITASEPKKDIK